MFPSQVTQDLENTLIPWILVAVDSLTSGKGKGSSSTRDGCFKCCGAQFQRVPKAIRASRDPRVKAKERARIVRANPEKNPKILNKPKVRTRVKPRQLEYPVLKS